MATPAIWLGGALAICLGLFAAGVVSKHAAEVKGARNEGIAIGTGEASTAALEAATETAEAFRAAEAEVVIPAERKAIYELCKRRASCRERHLP
jgi:hypothetical protein